MSNVPETKAGDVVRDKADSEEKPLPKSVALFESEIDVSTCNVANEFDQPCGELSNLALPPRGGGGGLEEFSAGGPPGEAFPGPVGWWR